MAELQITWQRLTSVWWLITWRSSVGAILIGGIAGAIIGMIGALIGMSIQSIQLVATVAGAVIGLAWAFYVLRSAFTKRYGDFRIALVPVNA